MTNIVANFKDRRGKWVKVFRGGGTTYFTVSGRVWSDINQRCKVGGYYQNRKPTYVGCTMSENFKDFQFFVDWHQSQVGFMLPDYNFDKDILEDKNKVYGEDTCVLVPKTLNAFFKRYNSLPTNPQGVFPTPHGKWAAAIGSDVTSRKTALGVHSKIEDAVAAYKKAKNALARRWYERLKSGEFAVDPRVIERMRTWEFICDWEPND